MELETYTYIRAIESALSSIIPTYKVDAIDSFIVKEKLSGRWSLHKFLWFPVWGNSTANRVCMKNGCVVGSYPNGVVSYYDYVKGNGTTQYFNSSISPYIPFTYPNAQVFALVLNTPSTGALYGVGQDIMQQTLTQNTGFIYTLSGYRGSGRVVFPQENTGFIYTLSGSVVDTIKYPISDNSGVFWNLSGGLT